MVKPCASDAGSILTMCVSSDTWVALDPIEIGFLVVFRKNKQKKKLDLITLEINILHYSLDG